MSVSREEGPADTTSRQTVDPEIHAAIVDNEGETLDPAHLWKTALTACERASSSTDLEEHSASVGLDQLRILMQPDAQAVLEQAHDSNSASSSAAAGQESRSISRPPETGVPNAGGWHPRTHPCHRFRQASRYGRSRRSRQTSASHAVPDTWSSWIGSVDGRTWWPRCPVLLGSHGPWWHTSRRTAFQRS